MVDLCYSRGGGVDGDAVDGMLADDPGSQDESREKPKGGMIRHSETPYPNQVRRGSYFFFPEKKRSIRLTILSLAPSLPLMAV